MDESLEHLKAALADQYTFDRVIGRGGMATVYLAEEHHPRRQVAVKVLTSEFASQPMRARFLREVDLASSLTHPHIVPVFAAGEAGELLYYVMPFIAGESLRQRLKRLRVLPLDFTVDMGRQVAGALHYAHELGVIHRDIKPENILLSGEHALVADFGIARAIGVAGGQRSAVITQTGLPIGTPAYMSPEQWSASGDIDRRTDIYSLGCVLLECVGGNIRDTNPINRVEAVRNVLTATPETARTTGGMTVALEGALAPDPDRRFATAADFAGALGQTTGPVTLVEEITPRKPLVAIALTALVLVVALASGLFLTSTGSNTVPGRVAVAPFENQTGQASLATLGPMAADWITQGLAQTGLMEVVGTRTALSAQRAESEGRDAVRLLADETGASVVVSGAFYLQGETVQFQARITDAEQRVLRAITPVTGPRDSSLAVVEILRQRVMGALATLFDERLSSWAQVSAQPPTFEAYQEYMEGLTLFMQLRTQEGLAHLYRAAEYDTTFATPLVFAAFAHSTQNEWAKTDSLARKVDRMRDRLPPLERHMVDWLLAMTRGDWDAGLRAVRRAAETAPGSEALSLIGVTASAANRPQETLDAFGQLDPEKGLMRGFFLYWSYLANAHHMLGDHDRELETARQAQRQYPGNPWGVGDEVRALAALGRYDEMFERLAVRAELPPKPQMIIGDEFRLTALELMNHGHDSVAQRVLGQTIGWFRALPPEAAEREQSRYGLARTLYVADRLDEAESLFRELTSAQPDSIGYRGYLGVIAARRGDRDGAMRISQELTGLRRDYLFGAIPFWQARIAGVLGEQDRAVDLIRQAFAEGRGFDDALHVTVDFRSLRDYAPFRELLQPIT